MLYLAPLAASEEINLLDYVSRAGVVVMLVLILYGGWRKWWVFGWQYRDCVEEKNEWKAVALKSTHIADAAATAGEHLVERERKREGDKR